MTNEEQEQELVHKLDEISRLVHRLRERDGRANRFILGLDAGMFLGKLQAELELAQKGRQ